MNSRSQATMFAFLMASLAKGQTQGQILNRSEAADENGAQPEPGASTVSLTLPSVVMNDLSQGDLVLYLLVISIQVCLVVCLCCVHRSKYLNVVSLDRIERELERQDRKHDQQAIQLGLRDPLAEALE